MHVAIGLIEAFKRRAFALMCGQVKKQWNGRDGKVRSTDGDDKEIRLALGKGLAVARHVDGYGSSNGLDPSQ